MSFHFRTTTQREPMTNVPTTAQPIVRSQTQQREASLNDRNHHINTTMTNNPRENTVRGNSRDGGLMSYTSTSMPQNGHRQLRPQRSFDDMSTVTNSSNTPSVGTGSDIGGRGAPPPTSNPAYSPQPFIVRRPTVLYPGARLASSRQTYNVRRRSQPKGISIEDFRERLERNGSQNPDSDSEYSSSELSTTTQATTVASDDESLLCYHEKTPCGYGKTSHRSGDQTSHQHSRDPRVQHLSPRSSGRLDPEAPPFDPRDGGSTSTQSSTKATVQFSEPLETVRYMPGAWDDHVIDPRQQQHPPRPTRDVPAVPLATRHEHRTVDKVKPVSRPQSKTHQATIPSPVPLPAEQPAAHRARAEDVLLDKIQQLKEETENLHLKQDNSSKVLEDTLVRLATMQIDKEAAERISNQEKELREGLAQELDDQERVIEELAQTVNETVCQLKETTHQLADAQNGLQERDGLASNLAELRSQFTQASKILVDVQKERDELKKMLGDIEYQNGKLQKELQQVCDEKKGKESYFVTRISTLETEKETLGIRVETMETTQKTHEMQFSDLARENVNLKIEIDKLDERIRALATEKTGLEEANLCLQGTVKGLEEDKMGLCAQVEGLEEDKKNLQLQVEALSAEKATLEVRIVALEEDRADLDARLKVVDGEKKALQNDITTLEEDKTSLRDLVNRLTNEKEKLDIRLQTLVGKMAGLNTDIQNVTGEKEELKSRLDAMEAERKDMDRGLDDMEAEINELKKRVGSLIGEKEELDLQIINASSDKTKMEEQLKELQAQIDETEAKHGALDMAYAAQVTLSGALAAERDSLKTEIDNIKANTTDLDARIEQLKDTKGPPASELKSDTKTTADLETQNQQLKNTQEAPPPDVTVLGQTITDKEAQIASLQEETAAKVSSIEEESSAKIAAIQEETSAKITTLTAERTELESKVTSLEARIVDLNQAADQVPRLLEQNNSLTTQLNIANAQIADLVLQLAAAAEQVNHYKKAAEASDAELAKTQRTIGHLKTRLENRPVPKKKTSVRIKQEDLVLVRSADKTTLQVVKKTDIRPSRSSSVTRSNSDSS